MFVLKTVNVFGKENVIMKSVGHITYILKPLIKTTNYKNLQQGLLTETKAFTRVVNPLPGLSLVFLSTLAKSLRITILLVRVMPWNSSFHFWCAFSAFPQPHLLNQNLHFNRIFTSSESTLISQEALIEKEKDTQVSGSSRSCPRSS